MTVHALDRRSARDHAAAFYISALDRPGRLYRKILRASHFTNRRHALLQGFFHILHTPQKCLIRTVHLIQILGDCAAVPSAVYMQINDAGRQIQSLSVDNAIRRLCDMFRDDCNLLSFHKDIHAGKNPLLTHVNYIYLLK